MRKTFKCEIVIVHTLITMLTALFINSVAMGGEITLTDAEQQIGGTIGYKYDGGDYALLGNIIPDSPQGLSDANLNLFLEINAVTIDANLYSSFYEDLIVANGSAYAFAQFIDPPIIDPSTDPPEVADDVHGGCSSKFIAHFNTDLTSVRLNINGRIDIEIEGNPDYYTNEVFVYIKLSLEGGEAIRQYRIDGNQGDISLNIADGWNLEAGKTYVLEAYAEAGAGSYDGLSPNLNLHRASFSLNATANYLPDLICELGDTRLSSSSVSGVTPLAVEIIVRNIGEMATEPKEVVDMEFSLQDVDGIIPDIVSTIYDVSIGKLRPGVSKRLLLDIPFTIPALTYGTFRLGAYVDSSDEVDESDEGNNTDLTTNWVLKIYSGGIVLLPDLRGEFRKISFHGHGTKVRTELDVINSGLVSTLRKQSIDIGIYLRPCGAEDGTDDYFVRTFVDQSVSSLKTGNSKTFRFSFDMPSSGLLEPGEYKFVAKIDLSDVVEELDEDNNEAISECFIFE